MSEMKHTSEPWRVGVNGVVVSSSPVPGIRGTDDTDYYGGHLVAETVTPSNVKRIIACVNACEGLTNEALEEGFVKDILDTFEALLPGIKLIGERAGIPMDELEIFKMAIAKARGKQAS